MQDIQLLKNLKLSDSMNSKFTTLIGKGRSEELDKIFESARINNINPFLFSEGNSFYFAEKVMQKALSYIKKTGDTDYYDYLKENGLSLMHKNTDFYLEENYNNADRNSFVYLYAFLNYKNMKDYRKTGNLYSKKIKKDLADLEYSKENSPILAETLNQLGSLTEYGNNKSSTILNDRATMNSMCQNIISSGKVKDDFFKLSYEFISRVSSDTFAEHYKYYYENNLINDSNSEKIIKLFFQMAMDKTNLGSYYSSAELEGFLEKAGVSIPEFNKDIFSKIILQASQLGQDIFKPIYIQTYNDNHENKIKYENAYIPDSQRSSYMRSISSYKISGDVKRALSCMKECGFRLAPADCLTLINYEPIKSETAKEIFDFFIDHDKNSPYAMINEILQELYENKSNHSYSHYSITDKFDIGVLNQNQYNDLMKILRDILVLDAKGKVFVEKQLKNMYEKQQLRDNSESIEWMKEIKFNPFTAIPAVIFESEQKFSFNQDILYKADLQFNPTYKNIFEDMAFSRQDNALNTEDKLYMYILPFILKNNVDSFMLLSEEDNGIKVKRVFDTVLHILASCTKSNRDVIPTQIKEWIEHTKNCEIKDNLYFSNIETESIKSHEIKNFIEKFVLDSCLNNTVLAPKSSQRL